jgi:hypothetical protein
MNKAIQTFTGNSFEDIVSKGGDSAWHVDSNRAKNYKYLVCCSSGGANGGSGFLVGKINRIKFHSVDEKGKNRYTICISEAAAIDVPGLWPGHRNPIFYTSLENLGIDVSALEFHKVSVDTSPQSLTIAQAKAGLAQHYGVSQDNIEILIKG